MTVGQSYILLAVSIVVFVFQAWAFIDAISHRAEAYPAADKLTKKAWLIILGLGLAVHMVFPGSPIQILNIAATIAAIVYLVDVRPALRGLTRRG